MNFQELKNTLQHLCKAYKLGALKGYRTEANAPTKDYNTAYFTTKSSKEAYQFHYKTQRNEKSI